MTERTKKRKIKKLVKDMLKESYQTAFEKIDKVLKSGALDIDGWDVEHNSMVLPKIIVTAILENESRQYQGKGTCFEKQVRKEVNNIQYFL